MGYGILQWARQYGYTLDPWISYMAAKGGHLHILQWIKLQDYKLHEFICGIAALRGHLHVCNGQEVMAAHGMGPYV